MKQMIKFLAMFAQGLAATVSLIATGADAQNARNCAPRDQVVTRLAEGYGETRQSIGLGANNSVIEVFASDESSTWTITMTAPNGITCLIASGQAFEMLPNPAHQQQRRLRPMRASSEQGALTCALFTICRHVYACKSFGHVCRHA